WEQLLIDATVIHGMDRWRSRLDGHDEKLRLDLEESKDPDDPKAKRIERDRVALSGLRAFALPLLEELSLLPSRAPWGDWIESLSHLAYRALRAPDRVLAILEELTPMASVGPVDLGEVRVVLERRLTDLVVPQVGRRLGHVFVGSVEEARGLSFETVFVPGLAE